MKLAYIAFTAKGLALAERLAAALGGSAARCAGNLRGWTGANFSTAGGLVFVGAAGIAVRAVAPFLQSKTTDPAVVVVDDCGRYAIPILSGHLGGANDLARAIGRACGALPVLTTATDANGAFAVDEWAKRQHCALLDPGKIKEISGRLLAGGRVGVASRWPIAGDAPAGVELRAQDPDILLDVHRREGEASLRLVPRIAVLGVGCKRGTAAAQLETALAAALEKSGLYPQAIRAAASIELKAGEPGLLEFCRAHGWPLTTYSAQTLQAVPGSFTPSAFVREATGVDNVCERSAVRASGGALITRKLAGGGVTMALALAPYAPTWRWQDETE